MPISDYIRAIRGKIGTDLLVSPGVAAVVINAQGEVLLQRRSDNGEWGLPGGALDPGEEPADTAAREVLEETGVEVVPERLVGVYSGPDHHFFYPNGDEVVVVSMVFACRPVSGQPRVNDDESFEVRYFAPDALPPMSERHLMRIRHALRNEDRAYFRRGRPGTSTHTGG
jgi:8-oxo-dGTP diphosphatase